MRSYTGLGRRRCCARGSVGRRPAGVPGPAVKVPSVGHSTCALLLLTPNAPPVSPPRACTPPNGCLPTHHLTDSCKWSLDEGVCGVRPLVSCEIADPFGAAAACQCLRSSKFVRACCSLVFCVAALRPPSREGESRTTFVVRVVQEGTKEMMHLESNLPTRHLFVLVVPPRRLSKQLGLAAVVGGRPVPALVRDYNHVINVLPPFLVFPLPFQCLL